MASGGGGGGGEREGGRAGVGREEGRREEGGRERGREEGGREKGGREEEGKEGWEKGEREERGQGIKVCKYSTCVQCVLMCHTMNTIISSALNSRLIVERLVEQVSDGGYREEDTKCAHTA